MDAARRDVADARMRLSAGVSNGDAAGAWQAALEALSARGRFGVRLGLERSIALLAELGSPERDVRGALVAGTNGKGSVVALVSAALRAHGVRHATTPKPHLVSYRERVMLDGRPLAPLPFARAVDRALGAADAIEADVGPATEFELLVGAVFEALRAESVQTAIVEVGLGGRLDATHAWDGGVAVVTNIGLDHQQYLGETTTAIATEKAAIIMPGNIAVTGIGSDEASLAVIRSRAESVGAPLVIAQPGATRLLGRAGLEVELEGYGSVAVALIGAHQAENAAVAAATIDALRLAGIVDVSPASLRAGFAAVRWPGRLELIEHPFGQGDARDLLLDGAHNPAGAAALAAALKDPHLTLQGEGEATLILAAMADKDVAGVCAALAAVPLLRTARVLCTSVGDARSLSVDALLPIVRAAGLGAHAEMCPDPAAAMQRAAESSGPVIVAGSLYLVGAVREALLRAGVVPDDGSLDPQVDRGVSGSAQ
jgi:dihydrofolate synthase/folylpolyglutamate synthase